MLKVEPRSYAAFPCAEASAVTSLGHQSCLCLAWTPPSCGRPEQQQVVAGYSDGTLRVFSISRTAMELKMHPHRTALTAIAFSTDGEAMGPQSDVSTLSRPHHTSGHGLGSQGGNLISIWHRSDHPIWRQGWTCGYKPPLHRNDLPYTQ